MTRSALAFFIRPSIFMRGLTLGELRAGSGRRLVVKEGLLGLLNGASSASASPR